MAVMVGNSAQFLREQSSALDEVGAPLFFDRAAVEGLYAAVRQAWHMIAVVEPVSASRRNAMIDALAIGVLRAVSQGERDVGRLARAACWYLISRGHRPAAPPLSATPQ